MYGSPKLDASNNDQSLSEKNAELLKDLKNAFRDAKQICDIFFSFKRDFQAFKKWAESKIKYISSENFTTDIETSELFEKSFDNLKYEIYGN